MKQLRLFLMGILCLGVFHSCDNAQEADVTEDAAVADPATSGAAATYVIDTAESVIRWSGDKTFVADYGHRGTIKIKEGSVLIEGDNLVGGSFTIDMTSIDNDDLQEKNDMESYNKLIDHLKSEDFFHVERYPTAKFVITNTREFDGEGGNNYQITGNMTMKDSTAGISFPAKVTINDNSASADADVIIDRSKFNVRYGSETYFPDLARDKIISNEIKLKISLKANREGV